MRVCCCSNGETDLRLPVEMADEIKPTAASKRSSMVAGGIEDWEDLEGYDVDR